ncbi:PepSY domain-containing protein [Methyloversatilis sp.]|uniref:PepSY domain-containing protein n=1 Tax=Methyloversatilis sp. TaxID=2569862 RepID=UPI003D26D1E8
MKSAHLLATLLITAGVAAPAFAEHHMPKTSAGLEKCMKAALKAKAGQIIKVELKKEAGEGYIYEFDIETPDGKAWDVECAGKSGKVVEVEEEVTKDHPKFAGAKVNEAAAREIALKKVPGEIVEVEYEIEPDGKGSYEFDIKTADGKEVKLEVDTESGEVVSQSDEKWQIGKE